LFAYFAFFAFAGAKDHTCALLEVLNAQEGTIYILPHYLKKRSWL